MYKKSFLLTFAMMLIGICNVAVYCQNDKQAVLDLINKWDQAYRSLDAKSIAALQMPDFELVDRFGNWYPQTSREENERMWAWGFANIYKGKPGPKHTVERIRFVRPDVAVVQTRAFWSETLSLSDGTRIPPHGQITTFVVVKQKGKWLIASQSVHNRMKDIDLENVTPN